MSETLTYLRRGDRLLMVQTTTWHGEERVDIRWWAWIGEQWRPTRAGVSLRLNELHGLIEILAAAWELFGDDGEDDAEGNAEGNGDAKGNGAGDVKCDDETLLERLLDDLTEEGGV